MTRLIVICKWCQVYNDDDKISKCFFSLQAAVDDQNYHKLLILPDQNLVDLVAL
jgi:hypothetical protein